MDLYEPKIGYALQNRISLAIKYMYYETVS
jgi:hypothetical protein